MACTLLSCGPRAAAIAMALLLAAPAFAQMGGGGGGMGGGNQSGSNMGRGMAGVMLTSGGTAYRADGTVMTLDDAEAVASRYLASLGNANLALDEIEEWDFNFYVVVKEVAPPGYKAFQLLVDKWTGAVMFEPGPNMMWNTKYRMRNGGRHMQTGQGTQPMPVTAEAAARAANAFVLARFPAWDGATVAEPDTFYGFYNFDVVDPRGMKLGMLGVNGSTGQVWVHTWHGGFVQGREF